MGYLGKFNKHKRNSDDNFKWQAMFTKKKEDNKHEPWIYYLTWANKISRNVALDGPVADTDMSRTWSRTFLLPRALQFKQSKLTNAQTGKCVLLSLFILLLCL